VLEQKVETEFPSKKANSSSQTKPKRKISAQLPRVKKKWKLAMNE